jgi:predicted HAD superfamily hydrolase
MGVIKGFARTVMTRIIGHSLTDIYIPDYVKVVSFDVFDTLVIRPSMKHTTDVFDTIYLEDKEFKDRRINAAKKAREISPFEEITIEEIYTVLNDSISCDDEKKAYEPSQEVAAELGICKGNPEAICLYNKIKKTGRRIIVSSDMYLDCCTIQRILANCGISVEPVSIYVSSEYRQTKRTGTLFKEIIKQERVKPREILHIGDNIVSDYIRPRECGIRSFLYIR